MAVTGNSELNWRHPRLLTFVADKSRRAGDTCIVGPDDKLAARDFVQAATRPDPGGIGAFEIITHVRRQYDITQKGQSIGVQFLSMPLRTRLSISLSTVLGYSPDLPQEAKDAITAAFNSYNVASGKSPEEFAAEKMAEYNATAARRINTSEFDLFTRAKYTWEHSVLEDMQEKWLKEVYEGDGRARVPGLIEEGQNLGGSGYRLQYVKDEYLTDLPDQGHPEQVVPVQNGVVGDHGREDKIVTDHAKQVAEKTLCQSMQPIRSRITDIKLWDNVKVEWEWGYIPNGCGGGFDFWRPVQYKSAQKKVLYAVATYAEPDERLRFIFESSLREAAEGAAIVGIVFQDFDLALTAFKQVFWKLIKQKTNETIQCLIPNLVVLSEDGPWVRV